MRKNREKEEAWLATAVFPHALPRESYLFDVTGLLSVNRSSFTAVGEICVGPRGNDYVETRSLREFIEVSPIDTEIPVRKLIFEGMSGARVGDRLRAEINCSLSNK